jgi:hypothetical protein
MRSFFFTSMSLCTLALLSIGCVPVAPSDRPAVVKVSGTVTHNQQPVEGATVLFSPVGDEGFGATGLTDAQGRFQLRTFEPGDGAVAGQYKVAISKYDMSTANPDLEDDLAAELREDTDQLVGPTPLLPVQYAEAATTPLSQEVSAHGDNDGTCAL